MKYLFSPGEVEVLAQVAWSRTLLAFDFDGTLAPIVPNREHSAMRARTAVLFERVCRLFPTAVISGRSRPDVWARLGTTRPKYVVGNHGLEPGADSPETEAALNEARLRLSRLVSMTQGLDLEDKRYSLAVHYRRARRKRQALAALRRVISRLATPMRLIPGKTVLNIVPGDAPDKGDALLVLRAKEGADTALYIGDDVTDEDVFHLDQPGRLLTIRVGRSKSSAAAYYLRSQTEVDRLLRQLIVARKTSR